MHLPFTNNRIFFPGIGEEEERGDVIFSAHGSFPENVVWTPQTRKACRREKHIPTQQDCSTIHNRMIEMFFLIPNKQTIQASRQLFNKSKNNIVR